MSSFFMNVKKTYLNQSIEKDFIKENNHYKDTTFCLESEKVENNFCLSSNDSKNIDFFGNFMFYYYLDEWEKNDYNLPKFGIDKKDLDPKITLNYLNKNKKSNKKIDLSVWTEKWEEQLKKRVYYSIKKEIFEDLEYDKIKNYFIGKNNEILEEYKQFIEVHSIVECKNNKWKYKLYGDDQEKNFSELKIFQNEIDCSNIKQGNLGTCYFLEALSTLSNYGQLLYQLFPIEDLNPEGIYELCLYKDGEWYKVLIDDYLIFKKRENENEPLHFYFAQPIKDSLYSCLLEKAFAKINGGYADIDGGLEIKAFNALTGFDSMIFFNDRITVNFINQLKIFLDKGYLVSGAHGAHAYSILRYKDNYLVARNPCSVLDSDDKKMQDNYEQKNNKQKNQKNEPKKIEDIEQYIIDLKKKYNKGEFKILENDIKEFFDNGISVCFCLFGAKVCKIKLDQIGEIKDNKNIYFSFKTFEKSKIVITLHKKSLDNYRYQDNENAMDKYNAKLELISAGGEKNSEINLITFNDFKKETLEKYCNFNDYNFEKEIKEGEYLLKIHF